MSITFCLSAYLTFNLQEDVVFLDPQVVSSNAGVLPTVKWLSHMDFQCTIFMNHIGITVLNAGLTVFEPTKTQQMYCLYKQLLTAV